MAKLLLLTGGRHPYEETTPVISEFLTEAGHDLDVSECASELEGDLSGYDAIVFNSLRQEMTDNDLNDAQRSGFKDYVAGVRRPGFGSHLGGLHTRLVGNEEDNRRWLDIE